MNNYLKKRLIPVILVKEGNVVQSIKFSEYKIIGKPVETISRLNKFGSDEIILLDISKKKELFSRFCVRSQPLVFRAVGIQGVSPPHQINKNNTIRFWI